MRLLILLLASLLCAMQAASGAENWPGTKPLRFEVIGAAGGLPDFVPRELSNYLSASIGVPVVVENRPGAGGNIAAGLVAKAEPDGHTLLVDRNERSRQSDVAAQSRLRLRARPRAGVDGGGGEIAARRVAGFSGQNIADVIAIAKQKPKSVSIAIQPIGSPNHLGAEMLAQYGNIDLTFVPYEGIAQALPDLMASRVDLAVGAMSSLFPLTSAREH